MYYACIYPTPPCKDNLLSGVKLVWIQNFPSPRLVAILRVKELNLSNYFPITGKKDGFMPFPRALVESEMRAGFELRSLILFPAIITIMLSTYYVYLPEAVIVYKGLLLVIWNHVIACKKKRLICAVNNLTGVGMS